jgi:hypothetical protein
MSNPSDDGAFLHKLEAGVRMELTVAETGRLEHQIDGVPDSEIPLDLDELRYEVGLRSLLGAIEAVEDGPW